MTAHIKVAERKCYINGQFVGSGRQFAKINPVDGTVVAQVHEADRAMVDAAVRAARAALKGPWGGMALQARVDLLRKVAEGIESASTISSRPRSPTPENRCLTRAISTFRAARRISVSSRTSCAPTARSPITWTRPTAGAR